MCLSVSNPFSARFLVGSFAELHEPLNYKCYQPLDVPELHSNLQPTSCRQRKGTGGAGDSICYQTDLAGKQRGGSLGLVAVMVQGNKESGQMDLKKNFYIPKLVLLYS